MRFLATYPRFILVAAFMAAASIAAISLRPVAAISETAPRIALENQVPRSFGDWRALEDSNLSLVSPQLEQRLDTLYADTLTRTYQNSNGERVMLSLAYGRVQNRELQVHKPEVCYVSQGFQLKRMEKADLTLDHRTIPVMRLVAVQGVRQEPITYWIRSGDDIVRGWFEQNRARILAGLRGAIPDGILVRVSTISTSPDSAYVVHDKFLADMLNAIPDAHRYMFLGLNSSAH